MSGGLRWTLALTLLVAATAGCGQTEQESYRAERLRPLEQRVEQDRARLAAVLRAARSGSRSDARAIRRGVEALRSTAGELSGLEPPASARRQHRSYTGAVEELTVALRRFAAELERGDSAGQRAAARNATAAVDRLVRAEQALDASLAHGA